MKVWLAISIYPESTEVLAASTRERLTVALRDSIDKEEWEDFQHSLRVTGEPNSGLEYDGDPEAVVAHFYGEFLPVEDERDAFWVGNDWLVREVEFS